MFQMSTTLDPSPRKPSRSSSRLPPSEDPDEADEVARSLRVAPI
jgi:hypothetical protein